MLKTVSHTAAKTRTDGANLPRILRLGIPLVGIALLPSLAPAADRNTAALDEIRVTATPLSSGARDRVPYAVQSFDMDDAVIAAPLSAADFLKKAGTSVTANDIQNNPLQPDLQFRGFTASPLLGTPQGISVFQNGVRLNGNFGHAVNWDMVPASFIDRMAVVGGANPLYGLNTLGGAVTIETKTGFTDTGTAAAARYGSFDRREMEGGIGYNTGQWGYYVAADLFKEDGWRDFSDSRAHNLYGAISWRGDNTEIDLFLNGGDSDLRGNGAIPVGLMEADRDAVFTHPDITENRMGMATLAVRHRFSEDLDFNMRLFARDLETDSFNGDGAEAEECDPPFDAFLCEEDGEPFLDPDGNRVPAGFDAVNNRSTRNQTDWGATIEAAYRREISGISHEFLAGTHFGRGTTHFESSVEFATLRPDRSTQGAGLFDAEGFTDMRSRTRTWEAYLSDTLALKEDLSATLSARYTSVDVKSRDLSGDAPDLNAEHDYDRLNAGAGITYRFSPVASFYSGIYQSSRTPTPVELACSHRDAPCTLPNSFIADPPLEDVVSRGLEAGFRGADGPVDHWQMGVFYITNHDDIIFQTTGGVTATEGFFSNVGKTRRWGAEMATRGTWRNVRWFANYTYLKATFRDAFLVSSPFHPQAVNGAVPVESGDRIPGLPAHQASAGVTVPVTPRLELGVNMAARAGQYLRGDEGNLLKKTDPYAIFGAEARYALTDQIAVTATIENIFDTKFETFGTFGEADEVLGEELGDSPVFLGPGTPRGVWVGLDLSW